MMENNAELLKSLLNAKRQFRSISMSGSNAHLKLEYAKLGDLYDAVEEALCDNGLVIIHQRLIIEGQPHLSTKLFHAATGQYLEDVALVISEKQGNQGIGAALTYMKKYAVLNLCAIAPGEDDDGQDEQNYIQKSTTANDINHNHGLPLVIPERVAEIKSKCTPQMQAWIIKQFGSFENIPAKSAHWILSKLEENAQKGK